MAIIDTIRNKVANLIKPSQFETYSQVFQLVSGQPQLLDWRSLVNQKRIECVQGVWVDNSAGTASVTVLINATNQRFVVPAGYQGCTPLFISPDYTMTLLGDGALPLVFVNFPIPTAVWPSVPTGGDIPDPLPVTIVAPDPLLISGTVDVGNFPTTQPVSIAGTVDVDIVGGLANPLPVDVGNFPATQPVSIAGTINVDIVGGLANPLPVTLSGGTTNNSYCVVVLLAPTGTGVCLQIQGSNTKKVQIQRISLSGYDPSSSTLSEIDVNKTSTSASGTSGVVAASKLDSANPSATAIVEEFTAGASSGANLGRYFSNLYFFANVGSIPTPAIVYEPASNSQPLTLDNNGEYVSISCNVTGVEIYLQLNWTET